jgi:hypothetical protein
MTAALVETSIRGTFACFAVLAPVVDVSTVAATNAARTVNQNLARIRVLLPS